MAQNAQAFNTVTQAQGSILQNKLEILLGPQVRGGGGLVADLGLDERAFLRVGNSTHIGLNGAAGYRGLGVAGGGGHLEADLLRGVLTLRLRDRDTNLLLLLDALHLRHRLRSEVAVASHNGETILDWVICALESLPWLANIRLLRPAVLHLALKNLLVHRRDRDLQANPSILRDALELKAGFANLVLNVAALLLGHFVAHLRHNRSTYLAVHLVRSVSRFAPGETCQVIQVIQVCCRLFQGMYSPDGNPAEGLRRLAPGRCSWSGTPQW